MGRGVSAGGQSGGGQSSLGYLFGYSAESKPAPAAEVSTQPEVSTPREMSTQPEVPLAMTPGRGTGRKGGRGAGSGGGETSLGYLFGFGEQGRPASVAKPAELTVEATLEETLPAAGVTSDRPAAGVPSEKDNGKPRFPWQEYDDLSPLPSPKPRARLEPPG